MTLVHAVLVGVSQPATFRWDQNVPGWVDATPPAQPRDIHFDPLHGVRGDLDIYETLLTEGAPGAQIDRIENDGATLAAVTAVVEGHATAGSCDTLVVVIVGHAFRRRTADPRELDHFDELFALRDRPLLDDWWGDLWKATRPGLDVVVIADTCHSESIVYGLNRFGHGMPLLAPPLQPRPPRVVFSQEETGPRRIFISASKDGQSALEKHYGSCVHGVLTRELQTSWTVLNNRESFAQWFAYAARNVSRFAGQTPVMTVIGPDRTMAERRPF